jgi:hypothetical protein
MSGFFKVIGACVQKLDIVYSLCATVNTVKLEYNDHGKTNAWILRTQKCF